MISVGTDILRVQRIEAVLERQGDKFVQRFLTPDEIGEYECSRYPARLLAKRFAAKEAVAKCLGTGIGRGVSWQDIAIVHDDSGAPGVQLSGAEKRGAGSVAISLSDEDEYVVAFAVLS